ncbi:uncharacterized protein LOC100679131 [Nasonia vitripennis]|uniref:F-box domain-containing protein n=1 Tax=Nasonia vitripennis TaxID=7425 RepID=A0A7M7GDB9_NASVI|nr:uncharacterized protein LOC100679131 [Nasonia vitripennis]
MNKGCWKLDEEDKALYIDLEEDTEDEKKEKTYSCWDQLPDILLEEIFSQLTIRERYYASLVCKSWYRAFKLPLVWKTFTLADTTLTRGKFNYYSGWQYVLDHMRTSTCLNKVGKNFKCLVFEPMMNFYNLYEFMNMISWYSERQGSDNTSVVGVGTNVRRLKFTFPCNMANRDNPDAMRLFGTGGKLLEALKRLMRNLENIKCLELIDLMLDSKEAIHLMDDICANCTQTLSKLVLINATKFHCPLLHVGVFLNLHTLVISPQNLHEDVIDLLGYTKLRHLHILQNRYSPKETAAYLPKNAAWKNVKLNNPQLRVHFEIESQKSSDVVLSFDANLPSLIPVHSIVLDNPNTQISASTILSHAVHFGKTLRVYALKGLTRYYLQKIFAKRIDENIVKICKLCPNLHTLMIRDKISTATLLEIASTAKQLRFLHVRRNVILKKCDADWLTISDWSPEHRKWIKDNCHDYAKTEKEVSKILGYRWHMLSEKEFASQKIDLQI